MNFPTPIDQRPQTEAAAGPVGQWLGRRQRQTDHGSNNLLEYSLHWETINPQLLNRFSCTVPGQRDEVGFEHYLNCMHPADVNAELKSIRSQLLDRMPVSTSQLRLRLDNTHCMLAKVTRQFQFSPGNGELDSMRLLVEFLPERR